MKTLLEWLKPGARVKRYMILQIVSIAVLVFCLVTLLSTYDLSLKRLIAYIILLTLSSFGVLFSFMLAQKNILYVSLRNISRKNNSIKVRKLLYSDPRIKKGPKIVVIGGGSGLANVLKGLKEFTSNITAVVNVSEDDLSLGTAMTPKEGWERKKLGDIALDMYRGFGIRRDQVTEDGVPCVRYGEIYTTYNVSFDTCISHTKEEFISSPKYFENSDLLFAITGESVEDIGKTIAYLGNERCLLGGDIICMKHEQNPKFLAYALSTTDAIKQKGMGKTKLKVVHTNAPALKAISIPIPPLSEQQAIVTHLDTLSEKLKAVEEKQEAIMAECDAMKQALLREVFE